MPSTSLLRQWASDPEQAQCWGLDAIADELDRLRRLETEVMGIQTRRAA